MTFQQFDLVTSILPHDSQSDWGYGPYVVRGTASDDYILIKSDRGHTRWVQSQYFRPFNLKEFHRVEYLPFYWHWQAWVLAGIALVSCFFR